MDYRSNSPQSSDPFSEEMDTSSVKEKAILNRTVPKFNNNFKAGYMPVENVKPGMRGRKTFAFWTLLVLLFILVIGNLILTVTIIGVLKLGHGKFKQILLYEMNFITILIVSRFDILRMSSHNL